MLANPARFVYARHWNRYDVLREAHWERQELSHTHALVEWERWLTRTVARALNNKGMRLTPQEKTLRLREAKNYHQRYQIQRQLSDSFL